MPEPREDMWRGIRPTSPEEILTRYEPPHDGTYVFGYQNAVNGGQTIYTVPAGKVLYLTSFGLSMYGTAGGQCHMRIYTGGAGLHCHLGGNLVAANLGNCIYGSFTIAMQLPASYYIVAFSGAANLNADGWILGYIKDA